MRKFSFLFAFLLSVMGVTQAWAQQTLTLTYGEDDGVTGTNYNTYIPFREIETQEYYQVTEFVLPASELTAMSGKYITQIQFQTYESSIQYQPTVEFYIQEVNNSEVSTSFTSIENALKVFNGKISVTSDRRMTIQFNEAYYYQGGNLLVTCHLTGLVSVLYGSIGNINFIGGKQNTNTAVYGESKSSVSSITSGTIQNFLPNVSFTYINYPTPTNVTVSGITSSSVTIGCTTNANTCNVRYKAAGDADWTVVENVSIPHTISSLQPATNYEVQVQAVNGENVSDWTSSENFTTDCATIIVDAANSFTEDFSSSTFPPACWSLINSGTYKWTRNASGMAYSGYYGDVYLVMPPISVTDNMKLSFNSYFNYASDYDKSSVVISANGSSAEDFTETLYTFTKDELPSSSSTALNKVLDLSQFAGQVVNIAFKYEGSNAHAWYVDDVNVYCEAPQDTYTVVGAFNNEASFFGAAWDPTHEANDMTLGADGNYTLSFENVALEAGTILYKVVKNHDWANGEWGFGNNNADYGVNEAGVYNITFTFNPDHAIDGNNYLKCEVTPVPVNATIESVVFSYGKTGENWTNLALTESNGSYRGTLDLSNVTENQNFKLNVNNNIWLGTNQFTLVDEESLVTLGSNYGDDLTLNVAEFSTYTITATWVEGVDAAAGWTLTIVGDEVRPQQTYTASLKFTNDAWDMVKVYAWKNVNGTDKVYTAAWPGDELTADANGVYTWTYTGIDAPAMIQFNDGTNNHQEEFVFENGKLYEVAYTAPKEYGIDVTFGYSFNLPTGWYYDETTAAGWETYQNGDGYMGYANQYWANTDDNDVTVWETPVIGVSGTDDVLNISCYKWAPSGYNANFDDSDVVLKVMYSTDKENWITAASFDNNSFATQYVLETKTVSGIPAGNYFFRFEINNIAFDYLKGFSKAENSTYTVSLENAAGWNDVRAYAWSGEEGKETKFLGNWPGAAMTQGEGNVWTLTFEAPLAPAKIIFNNNNDGKQTADFVFEAGKTYTNATVLALTEAATENEVVAGAYDEVTVEFTMGAGKFAAICLPFATTTTALGEGVKAWAFTGYTDGNIDLSTTTELAAATPYIIYAANGINGLTFQNVTIESNEAGKVEQDAATFQGSYVKMPAGTMIGMYGVTPDGMIQKAGLGASMKAFRAYFEDIKQNAKLVCDGMIIGEATGIDTIENAELTGELYDLQGRRVNNAQKGIYIQNGKKFVVK